MKQDDRPDAVKIKAALYQHAAELIRPKPGTKSKKRATSQLLKEE